MNPITTASAVTVAPSIRRPLARRGALQIGLRFALSIGLAVSLSGSALAQNAPADNGAAAAKPAAPQVSSDYIIGADDVIGINAVGHDDVNQIVSVLPNGTISVNGIEDPIKVEGMTLGQLKDRIYLGLDKLYANLILTVSIRESHSRNVYLIAGAHGGQYPLRKGMRVSTLIAASGGLPTKTKLVTGYLVRDFKSIKLDIPKIVGPGQNQDIDLLLQPNDELLLDSKEEPPPPAYSITGAVSKQGTFPLPLDGTPVTLSKAMAEAGGYLPNAALTRVSLSRHGQKIPLNLYPLLVEGKADTPEAKTIMEEGDAILVPDNEAKFMVLGQVNHADAFPLPETQKVTALEAITKAGGANQFGDLKKAVLVRSIDGKPTAIPVDLQQMITRADLAKSVQMQNGDVLYIPGRRRTLNLGDILNPFLILNSLGLRPFGP